jgi:hypothetical protein
VSALPAFDTLFLPWLLGSAGLHPGELSPAEQQALRLIDKTLALPQLPANLLPRAAALIPQLMAMLRQPDLPVPVLAQQVAKDLVLTAEVLRLASSPYYKSLARADVTDLAEGISLIGVSGLNTVIARVVLKPIFESAPGPLSARAGSRLWQHSEVLAARTAERAAQAGLPMFDGYLLGLLHGSGTAIALRLLDRAAVLPALPVSAAFALTFSDRTHRLFGQAAQDWAITPGFTRVCAEARSEAPFASGLPLMLALHEAQPLVMAELVGTPAA